MNIVQQLAAEEKARLLEGKTIPEFQPGDTLRVNVRIKEGERERIQAFEGVCIARDGGGINETFTVRKISFGEGVERRFPILSPNIDSIEVKRRGVVRRAKLYYLRDRRGKSARIAERQTVRPVKGAAVPDARVQLGPTAAVTRHLSTPQGDMMATVVGEIPMGTAERIALSMRVGENDAQAKP